MAKKVLVGLSGGMDSAYCAKKLADEGFDVTGVYFSFCDSADPAPARETAKKLGIDFIEKDERADFEKKVITPFIEEYENGRTPNPCVRCNAEMKFACLVRTADEYGIDLVATGHYARIEKKDGKYALFSAADENKDQSYFLWRLDEKTLSRTLFPLADTVKETVKKEAGKGKKESMDICFVPDSDTERFVLSRVPENPGDIVWTDGTKLGTHKGIANYTVGQRRGLGVATGERAYVVDIVKNENKVVLGTPEDMEVKGIYIEGLNFISREKNAIPTSGVTFKSRSRMKKTPCRIEFTENGAKIFSDEKMRRVSRGQSVAVYLGNELVFGGTVEENLC